MSEKTPQGVDKVTRYDWKLKDLDKPGRLAYINKHEMVIPEFQRDVTDFKVKNITREWSWIACGAISLYCLNGIYYVLEGQHRVMAALRRSDIQDLPCVIFEGISDQDAAIGFVSANTNRKPITALDTFKAKIVAEDEVALFVRDEFQRLGIKPKKVAKSARQIKSMGLAMKLAAQNRERFTRVFGFLSRLCADAPIREKLIDGIWYLDKFCGDGLEDPRLKKRLLQVGESALVQGADKASAFYSKGGARVWAEGMIQVINLKLRNKFEITPNSGEES